MKNIIPLVLFSSLLTAAYSAVYLERQSAKPGHENMCYDKEDNVFYKKGEEMKWRSPTVCGRKICVGANWRGSFYAEIQTCGVVEAPPDCHIEVNLNLPYPGCCEMIVCPKPEDIEKNVFIGQNIKL